MFDEVFGKETNIKATKIKFLNNKITKRRENKIIKKQSDFL